MLFLKKEEILPEIKEIEDLKLLIYCIYNETFMMYSQLEGFTALHIQIMRFRREVSNLIDYYEDKDLPIATKEIEEASRLIDEYNTLVADVTDELAEEY